MFRLILIRQEMHRDALSSIKGKKVVFAILSLANSVVICSILFSPHFVLTNTNEYCTDIVYHLYVI